MRRQLRSCEDNAGLAVRRSARRRYGQAGGRRRPPGRGSFASWTQAGQKADSSRRTLSEVSAASFSFRPENGPECVCLGAMMHLPQPPDSGRQASPAYRLQPEAALSRRAPQLLVLFTRPRRVYAGVIPRDETHRGESQLSRNEATRLLRICSKRALASTLLLRSVMSANCKRPAKSHGVRYRFQRLLGFTARAHYLSRRAVRFAKRFGLEGDVALSASGFVSLVRGGRSKRKSRRN